MLKEEILTERKRVIENIFRTMDYNGNQAEDFSSILNWLDGKKFKLESTIDSPSLFKESTLRQAFESWKIGKFNALNKEVTVFCSKPNNLEKILANIKVKETPKEIDIVEKEGRLHKLHKLVDGESNNLTLVENISSRIPTLQIKDNEKSFWLNSFNRVMESLVARTRIFPSGDTSSKVKIVLIQLSNQGYSTTARMIELFKLLVQSDEQVLLVLDKETSGDMSCFLPAAYFVEMVNKSKIRNSLIDVLYTIDCLEFLNGSKLPISFLLSTPQGLSMNDIQSIPFRGVISRSPTGKMVKYIIDHSAEIQSTVESLASDMWLSGAKINYRTRATVFVHQSVYKDVIDAFTIKLKHLKVGSDLEDKSLDFIKRGTLSTESYKTFFQKGIKAIPLEADGSGPTLVYNIGTSSKFMTNSNNLGLGHLLFVIPYRSVPELFSLANNTESGDNTDVVLFCSNNQTAKQIITGIKGSNVMVNQIMSQFQENQCFRRHFSSTLYVKSGAYEEDSETSANIKNTVDSIIFDKAVQEAQNYFKNWSSMTATERMGTCLSLLGKVEESIGTTDTICFLKTLVLASNNHVLESPNVIQCSKPVGITGLLVSKNLPLKNTLMGILRMILKGNVVIVVGNSTNSNIKPIFEGIKAVQFVETNITTEEVVNKLKDVNLVWILESESAHVMEQKVALGPCSIEKVIVGSPSTIEFQEIYLQIPKVVYL